MSNLVLVASPSTCPFSAKQVDLLRREEKEGNKLKGAILCDKPEHASTGACKKVKSFPTFCNVDTGQCLVGLRETKEEMDQLKRLNDAR